MINVTLRLNPQGIVGLEVSGHAMAGEYGHDLVCAGVSCVMTGLLNALSLKTEYHCQIDENTMVVTTENVTEEGQLILEVGLIQLETIASQFPQNIQIKELKS